VNIPLSIPAVPEPVLRHRLSSQDRRRQLLEHAVELFARHGFKGTRTKDIAAACGVSEAILFRHFATKEDLYHAILDTHQDAAGAEEWMREMKGLAARRDDEGFVRCLLAQIIKSFREDSAFHRLMFYAALEGNSFAVIFHERLGVPTFEFLCGYVAQRQKAGAFSKGDPAAMVHFIVSAAVQFAIGKYVFGAQLFPQSNEEMEHHLTGLVLGGIKKPNVTKNVKRRAKKDHRRIL
jgi:TetR/AcrR family transcriptional regulator